MMARQKTNGNCFNNSFLKGLQRQLSWEVIETFKLKFQSKDAAVQIVLVGLNGGSLKASSKKTSDTCFDCLFNFF